MAMNGLRCITGTPQTRRCMVLLTALLMLSVADGCVCTR
jgi:hypothetical protein